MGGSSLLVFIVGLLAVAVDVRAAVSDDGFFEEFLGEWETCKRINSTDACYRTRDAHCRTVTEKKPAPWRHCTGKGMNRLTSVEECECQQDCVVTKWSDWTPCNGSQVYTTRRRTVAAPMLRGGKPCPALHEEKRCEANSAWIDQLQRYHTWKVGSWLECVPFGHDSRRCGHGLRRRSVECVDLRGRIVNQTYCLEEEAYLRVLPPQEAQLCEVPCPCRLSVWGSWSDVVSNCSLLTPSLVRHRTRSILQHPTLEERCQPLEQSETITTGSEPVCPTYRWETSFWSECTVQDESAACGVGLKQRYIYCMEETSDGGSKHVSLELCDSSVMPSTLSSCEVACTHRCVVTEWGEWERCRNDTCELTYTHRNRTVLVEASGQSLPCPHLAEFHECPQIPCVNWAIGDFSPCFPYNGEPCGLGTHSRLIYCQSHTGEMYPNNDLCQHIPHGSGIEECYKHCEDDACVISDWSEWSECSEPCGDVTGLQTQSRYLVVNGTGPCVHAGAEFSQQQNCSVATSCEPPDIYYIEYSHWEECYVPGGGARNEEMCVGTQTRSAVCFREGKMLTQEECPIHYSMSEEQPCTVPCSSQCLMSDWAAPSECSASCKTTRSRRLLRFGENCPLYVDASGVETETAECECKEDYSWLVEDSWSPCHVFPTPLSQLSHRYANTLIPDPGALCGLGYRNRSVVCRDGDGEMVAEGFCNIENKPFTFETCMVPCDRRCVIGDWTSYSVCSSDHPMMSTRQIYPFRDSSNSYLHNCPELASVVIMDEETCPLHDFSRFQWANTFALGELHSCYLDPDTTCGQGKAYRTYGCVSNRDTRPVTERAAVNPEFCDLSRRPHTIEMCADPCNIDCEYSEYGWSAWSSCSVTCGMGFMTRTRTIERVPVDEGRLCGHLNETSICENPACDYVEYIYSPPSRCQALNQSRGCGDGTSISEPICLVNGVAQRDISPCSSLGPRAPRILDCAVPCEGECVVSEWSRWKWCPECHSGCYTRKRRILRMVPDCEYQLQQWEQCSANNKNAWRIGEWTDCFIDWTPRSVRDYCGAGFQRRMVECIVVRSGDVTYDEKCSHLPKPSSEQGCSISCPVDCVVGSFGDWVGCKQCTSDLRATRRRERRMLVPPQNGGRGCPHLVEEQSCPNIGCDEYFVETNSSSLDCVSQRSDQVCGQVSRTMLLCRLNAHYEPLDVCVKANQSGLIVHNAGLLNHGYETYCDIECPSAEECVFTEYGAWSECLYMCDWPVRDNLSEDSFQFRSWTLLSAWNRSRDHCHELQQETRVCTPNFTTLNATPHRGSKCIRFDWTTSEWYRDNTRDVQCHSNSGSQVEEFACVKSEEPVSLQNSEGEGECGCPFLSKCNGVTTQCVCEGPLEMVSSLCLPVLGCLDSPQLLNQSQQCLPSEECSEGGECVCPADQCVTTPTTTDTMTPNGTASEPTSDTSSGTTDILLIVLITCVPLLLLIVILLVIIIVTCKCRQHLERRRRRKPPPVILHQNQRLNNQSDALNKPLQDLKEGGVRVQEVSLETTSHPMHPLHNGSASSGFVEEMEHDILKYGQASFNGYSQTQSEIDEAGFAPDGNPYAPYPLHDPPSSGPHTPHPPYAPYEIGEESDGVPYHSRHGNGMRPVEQPQPHVPAHLIPRSLSEEAHLAQISSTGAHSGVGGAYNRLVEEQPYPEGFHEHSGSYSGNFYQPSPATPRTHHSHHHNHPGHHSHHHHITGGRDNRLMVGLDNAMVRAIEEVTASEGGSRSPSVSSVGSRSSARRSGRRRHHHRSHHAGNGGGYREPRVHSPVSGPSHSAQGYYGYYQDGGEEYMSNTLPRSGSKQSSHGMPQRSPRHPPMTGNSPLVNNAAGPSQHVRSASNEILETRRDRPIPSPLDMSHDHPASMPRALPDEFPYHATNPLTISPPMTSSQMSEQEEADYDHISPTPGAVPAPPPPPPENLKPPMATLAAPLPSTSSSTSPGSPNPPPSPGTQFPQELFNAIQKRANSMDTSPSVSKATSSSPALPAPPPRTVSNRHGRSKQTSSRFTATMLSAYDKENPMTPPTRGPSSSQGQTNSLVSNQPGVPPPPPPPPPVRT